MENGFRNKHNGIFIIGALAMLAGLHVADGLEHAPWIVTAVILLTLGTVFALCLIVVGRGLRSYRLGGQGTS